MRFINHFNAVLIIFVIILNSSTAYSRKTVKRTDSKKTGTETVKEANKKEETSDQSEFVKKYSPGIGIIGGINKPTGDVAAALGLGYGGQLYADIKLPIRLTRVLQFRGRVNAGYYIFPGSGDFSGKLTMIPAFMTFEISYPAMSGFRPFFGLGFGATFVSISGDSGTDKIPDATSTDGSMVFSIGTGYTARSIPNIEYRLDFNYLMAFETVIGQFSQVSIGVAYRFQSPWAWMKDDDKSSKDKAEENSAEKKGRKKR
jgi:hypothetical protein